MKSMEKKVREALIALRAEELFDLLQDLKFLNWVIDFVKELSLSLVDAIAEADDDEIFEDDFGTEGFDLSELKNIDSELISQERRKKTIKNY